MPFYLKKFKLDIFLLGDFPKLKKPSKFIKAKLKFSQLKQFFELDRLPDIVSIFILDN